MIHQARAQPVPFLRRVALRNYKSIGSCDVELQPLTLIVGRNGSGKSNFLDALRFVADALRTSLDHALRERGGIREVRRRSTGHPTHFRIGLSLNLPDGGMGDYQFQLGAQKEGAWEVTEERCRVETPLRELHEFHVRAGQIVRSSEQVLPPLSPDRLLLATVGGFPAFRAVHDGLSRMGFYSLNPSQVRALQPPDAGDLLLRDGRNIASVLGQLEIRAPETKQRVVEYLNRVVPGVMDVTKRALGQYETLEFRQLVAGSKEPWTFLASNMSDGTLRALGILVALFQTAADPARHVPVVGIEEPEVALHPAATGVLMGCLEEASATTQVLVTSHSADLLDTAPVPEDAILVASSDEGVTRLAGPDEVGLSVIRDHLFTPGELLRQDQLQPAKQPPSRARNSALFEEE